LEVISQTKYMLLTVKIISKIHLVRKGLLLFFCAWLTGKAVAQEYNFHNFSSDDGLAQSYIYSITQDLHGYLWVGTGNGVSRFNGFKFDNFTTPDSLADNFITCSYSDGEFIWFGHMNGKLSEFDGKNFHAVVIPHTNSSPITHFAKSPDGMLWASTYANGLVKLDNGGKVTEHYLFKDPTTITTFDFLNDNEVLAGTNTGLYYCGLKEPGEIEILQTVSEIPESKVVSILKMNNSSGYYIATESDGIFRLIYRAGVFKVSELSEEQNLDLTNIQDLFEDRESNIWIALKGDGLVKIVHSKSEAAARVIHFNKKTGFITDNVKTVYEDREGNIWSGNYGDGLSLITPRIFSVWKFNDTVYGHDIFSICIDQHFRWIGTEKGLIKTDQSSGKIIKFYSKGSGLPKDTVTTIFSENTKVLWIGTGKNGLYRMDVEYEKIIRYPVAHGVLENSITNITGKGNQLWIGTQKGLFSINSITNEVELFSINHGGLPHNFINCLYLDSRNRLWVSTLGNMIAFIKDGKVNKIPVYAGSGILSLGPITEDKDSRIWMGTKGSGVFLIESDSIANLTVREGLLSNYCYSLICDNKNNIWVGHKGGLSKIRSSDFSIKPIQHIENSTDAYNFNSNSVAKDQNDRVWFGSNEGLISYNQPEDSLYLAAPVLGITSVKINGEETAYRSPLVLSPGKYKITIDYLGISLKEPALVTYQYILEGYDQWSEITKNTSITFNNLTEGKYTFLLKAASGDGAVTEKPLTLKFIINKPVWKKWWFYLVNVSALILLTFSYVKRREHKFVVEKRILEEKVRERTSEIQAQKNEIELQRDTITKKNVSITSSIEYASHIQNAVLPPSDYVEKMFPENFILNKPKDIVSGDFYWLSEKDNKIIFTVADCTGHGVPGAFMSILGITLLNEIVNIQGITRSDTIVTELRDRVISSLQQNREAVPTSDGMDLALCVLDIDKKKIQYTGAMNNIVFIRDGKIEIFNADRFSVSSSYGPHRPFTMNEFDCLPGDTLYLFSDGYQDQFGGEFNKKFLSKNFYLTLLEIHKLPMPEQWKFLDEKISKWMEGHTQTDDITVMGIRL
jgi:ligand-binding sensor domain-containing protein/serine phosphatase RsbU (regulator of sigma subunit)